MAKSKWKKGTPPVDRPGHYLVKSKPALDGSERYHVAKVKQINKKECMLILPQMVWNEGAIVAWTEFPKELLDEQDD